MRRARLALPLFALPLAPQQAPFNVPRGSGITVDGLLSPDEWHDAARFPADNLGHVLLKHDDRYLYLGIRATRPGFPSVCVDHGDTVRVLHASAALGALRYTRAGDRWTKQNEWNFAMRSPDTTAQARAQRDEYLRQNGWVASTVRMGSGAEKEMVIPLAFLGTPARLSVAYYLTDDDNAPLGLWPASVGDACAEKRLAQGFASLQELFDGRGWAVLALTSSPR